MIFLTRILLLIVLSTTIINATNDELALNRFRGHVKKVNGQFEIVSSLADVYKFPDMNVEDVPANAFWDQTYNFTGWSILEIETFSNQSDIDQVYSAGLIEGHLTKGKKKQRKSRRSKRNSTFKILLECKN